LFCDKNKNKFIASDEDNSFSKKNNTMMASITENMRTGQRVEN
jgi:hypothetical protein